MSEHTFDPRQMDAVTRLNEAGESLRLARLEAIADLDSSGSYVYGGYTSVSAFLIHRCGMGAGEANREVFLARSLQHLPYGSKLVAAGRLTIGQLEVLAHAHNRHPDHFESDEATLGEAVAGLGLADTRRAVDYWCQALDDPADPGDDEPSRVHLSKTWGGRGRLDGDLDPETHNLVSTALDALISEMVRATPKHELVTRRRIDDGVSPALDAAGSVLVLNERVKCAFVLRPCQSTPMARRAPRPNSPTDH